MDSPVVDPRWWKASVAVTLPAIVITEETRLVDID
jgi:hypothetical protein